MAPQATDPELVEELERSRRMLAEAQALARIGSWEWDVAANRVVWSDELFRIYGYEPGAFEPTYETFLAHVHADDREAVDARNHQAFADHQPFDDTKRILKADGTEILMRTQGEVITAPDGTVARMLGVCEDVSDRLRAQEAQALLASVVETSNDAIYTVDSEGAVTSWNPAAERLFGYTEREALGLPARRLVPDATAEEDERLVARALADRPIESWETLRMRKDGSQLAVSVAMSPLRDIHGRVAGVSVIARDVSERRRFEQQLRYLSDHDALTGLPNRSRFEEELERAVDYAQRYATGGALFLLDLDGFKRINDALGHAAGDELIRSVSQALRGRLRSTDVLARIGGDELAVLVPVATPEQAEATARSVVCVVREHTAHIGGQDVRVTTSLGGVRLDDAGSASAALARADLALYAAKDAGRDRHVLFGPEQERARAASGGDWEDRIEHALTHGALELFVQPLLELATGEKRRYEALLRMHHQGEVVLPGAFLPTAERSGQIHAIDRWVVTEAIGLLAAHPGIELEVNLSGRSLDDADLIGLVATELTRTGVEPTRLILEITETATIAKMQDARRLAEALAELGCRFAIDDFGTGFGSFSYLKHLPAAFLKIDGEFVASPRSRTDELVIEAIVGMAQGLGKQTIAEFVGDEETVTMLRAAGVDYAQGFHIGRPFPATQLRS
jgi:diguanylate cyclase (GGDEF)-like protein/PAS domain S-box-containing protein